MSAARLRFGRFGPTGDTWYRPPQPIWGFAITNAGNSNIVWMAGVQVKGESDRDYSNAGGHIDWPQGVLGPGQGVVTEMIVPARRHDLWRGYIEYWPISLDELKTAQADLDKLGAAAAEFESVVTFCSRPRDRVRRFNDEWYR